MNGDANWRKKVWNSIKPTRFCHVSRFCAAYSQVKSLLSTKGNDLACRSLEKGFFYTPDESSNLDLVWHSRPSQEEEGLVKCLYQAYVRHTESGCPRKYAINGVLRKLTTAAGRPAGLVRVV